VAAAESGVSRFGEHWHWRPQHQQQQHQQQQQQQQQEQQQQQPSPTSSLSSPPSRPTAPTIEYAKTEHLPLATRIAEYDYVIVEPEEAAAAGALCEQVEVVYGGPSLRWRDWVAAVRTGRVGGLGDGRRWEEWLVVTRPVLVLLHCGGGRVQGREEEQPPPQPKEQEEEGSKAKKKKKGGVDLSEWMTDE
jgi:hypothetical protein